jgi:hypothetical protein
MMRDSGMTPLSADHRRDDPFFAHFPDLKSHLKNTVKGRRASELRKIVEASALFQYWHIDMRYAPTEDVKDAWIASWKASAHDLVNRMDSL